MSLQNIQKVVAAKTCNGGSTVFLTEDNNWTPELCEAELIWDEAHAQIRMLSRTNPNFCVTDVRLADVFLGKNGPELVPELWLGS